MAAICLRLRSKIHAKKPVIVGLSRTACAWKKHLDGGLPSRQREKTFANSQNLPPPKFWLFAELAL
jgi:hypothetical protein